VSDLHGSALTAEDDLPDAFVATHSVVVHDGDDEARLSDAFVGDVEDERLVEDRVEGLVDDHRLLLLNLLTVVTQPDLHVGI